MYGSVSTSQYVGYMSESNILFLFSEELKEAVSVKSQSLQTLQDENNKLTQELDKDHKDQSDRVKVQHKKNNESHNTTNLCFVFQLFICRS